MTVDTKGFREAHHELPEQTAELRLAAELFPTLATEEREETRARILSYLRERVEPHTKLDELLLYPEVATRLGDPLVARKTHASHHHQTRPRPKVVLAKRRNVVRRRQSNDIALRHSPPQNVET